MSVTLPELPFAKNALEPVISAKTLEFHHGKHHNAYVTNLNKLIEGTALDKEDLESIIKKTAGDASQAGVFNNAAQVWNHSFYWKCMQAGGGGEPGGALAEKINASFGSFAAFKEEFAKAAATQFGSGWAWLIADGDKLSIMKTANADTPLAHGKKALLTIDVWEHAYYLDFQNRRPDYIADFLDKLVNWEFVASNL
ncbi:MAG: superoxide dismutase [Leptospiraceae bacterium]|nr:superoxide dismutase [Leptospiraceae bacterium]